MSSAQVEFFFIGPPLPSTGPTTERLDFAGFSLNGIEYRVGDCAFLFPEDESQGQHYVAQVLSCFQLTRGQAADPHCVEVAWFERRSHLDVADVSGLDDEHNPQSLAKEVVALEETDVNPIGCISGKALVLKAPCYEEACRMATSCGMDSVDWFFCRGVYKQSEKCIIPFPEFADLLAANNGKRLGKRAKPGLAGQVEVVADSDDVKRQRFVEEQPAAPMRRTGKLVSGRTCVECGATQTPQWREGPAGPKTLCNACGVRYGRAQQRANKRAVSSGLSRPSCGSGARNGRTSKTSRSEAAPPPRASVRSAAAHAAEETSQRPLRQAALMSASRTAAYARTGVFPLNSEELEMQLMEGDDGVEVEGVERDADPPLAVPQAAPLAGGPACRGSSGSGASPHNSSLDASSDSPAQTEPAEAMGPAQAPLEVEVLVDGEADASVAAAAAAAGCPFAPLPVLPYQLMPAHAPLLLSPSVFTDSGVVPSAAVDAATAISFGCETPLPLPPAPVAAAAVGFADAGLMSALPCVPCDPSAGMIPEAEADACAWMSMGLAMADDGAGPCGADDQLRELQDAAAAADDEEPALAGPAVSGDGRCASASCADASCAHIVSAPVSPSARASCGGADCGLPAGMAGCGSCYGGGGSMSDDMCFYGGCSGVGSLDDDEYTPLVAVEVDFGLGGCMAGSDLFDEVQLQAGPAAECVPVSGAADLPALAAAVERYSPDTLAPGTIARSVLDCLPALLAPPEHQQPAAPATAPAQAPLLSEAAVAPLVVLGRQASRASCEAVAADAAYQAVSQVWEAHQEANRRAREVAAASLGRLNTALSHLATGSGVDGVLVGAAGAPPPTAASHLIDLRDLCGGGMGAYGRDGAEMVVAVRS
ncbi:hypothetical protein GPECTOR_24g169 [Gonium pectorale]|uniref:GATA-type domain-containing protein n=1 Tax=Gonium pectorale TaxID=33097 RepID=A0A150GHQ1_GONPE|nr:hypothetical protein GPECTOR_24g169 [Gonium pectorale]|eukprot:KXZ48880.1 hypothetical protein GPECTOR_24g169 [Gonium pectorale]